MKIISSPNEMRSWAESVRAKEEHLALVPTMGYLHEGHLALVKKARELGDRVVVSIFVNPTQFGPGEDLLSYPGDLRGDLSKLEALGVDAVFTPTPETMYGENFNSYVIPTHLADTLCGQTRPGHFRGVCTVVLLLFRITLCQTAVFGEKDYQQLQILKQLARDLWLDVRVVGLPIVREEDGLAMSSRNVHLSAEERLSALSLNHSLTLIGELIESGERSAFALRAAAAALIEDSPDVRIDYLEIVDSSNLAPLPTVESHFTCAMAVFVGTTRLIDNRSFSISCT